MTQSKQVSTLQQQDLDLSLSILLAASAVLKKHSVVSAVELDNLRIRLSDQHVMPELTLFTSLQKEGNSFFEILSSRYSESEMAQLLLRLSLRRSLTSQSDLFLRFGQRLLESSKAFFNRRIHIYLGDKCLRGVLLSTLISEYASHLDGFLNRLDLLAKKIAVMPRSNLRSPTALDQCVDTELAQTLSLSDVLSSSFPGRIDQENLFELSFVYKSFHLWSEGFVDQLKYSLKKNNVQAATVFLENMKLECKRLESIHLPQVDHLESWERMRMDILKTIENWNLAMTCFQKELFEVIFRFDNFQGAVATQFPDDVRSSLASSMITQGVDPLRTKDALSSLLMYLENNAITPDQLVSSELKKIDPTLNPQILEKLQSFGAEDSILSDSQEKDQSWQRYCDLLEKFQNKLERAGILALTFMFIVGCGVKKSPVGPLEDYRPEIPYKIIQGSSPEVESIKMHKSEKEFEDNR